MASHTTIVIDWNDQDRTHVVQRYRVSGGANGRLHIQKLARALYALISGILKGTFRVQHTDSASACAAQTVTCAQASAVDNTDTFTTLGVTLSVKASPATENEFAKGASNSAMATNLKNAINAHSVLSKYVIATASGAVVTITFLLPGAIFNLFSLAEAGNGMTLGAATYAGGAGLANATVDTYSF